MLSEYIETLCGERNLGDHTKDIMLAQIKVLKEKYGESIPKDDFLTVIGRVQNSLNTGYKKQPVDVLEFLLSSEYLNLEGTLRPKIKNILIDIFGKHSHCYEICLSGSVRWGKTYLACCGFAYHIYKLSCLYNPQTHYALSPGSEIIFTMQSTKEAKAKRNFSEFKGMIDGSDYFKKHFPLQGRAKNYAQFPNNITVKPIATTNTAAMSENVYAAFIDEANFLQVIKGSAHQGLDEQYYDQATVLYQTIKDRIQNQFKDIATGEWPGKLYLASSANHTDDFIQNKIKEAKKSNHIYVADYALWEVKDTDKYCGKKFWVQMPTELDGGAIYEKKPKNALEDIIEVPIEFKEQFDADLHGAIRNVAGRAISRESKFIPSYILLQNIESYNQYYQSQQIFNVQEICLNDVIDIKSLLNTEFIQTINPFFTFHSHCDLALTQDSSGIAFGATVGAVTTKKKETLDVDTKEKVEVVEASAPVYTIFGLLRIVPPKNGQVDIAKVEKLYLTIKEYLTNFTSFSADRAYSITLIQNLRRNGVTSQYLSVDKTADAYIEKKTCLTENRCWVPEHESYKKEVKGLMFDAEKNKIDHHAHGEKDVADSVAGTIYVLSKRKATYKKTDKPKQLHEMRKESGEEKTKVTRSNYGNRPRASNRSRKWQRRRT